tara:strand:- start:134 stop:1009 length:876 start_codon:yes stop_codon:yes gene_type:complete
MALMPGDPIDVMVQSDPNLTTSDAERLKALYGLDKPLLERYKNWLSSALTGDFGYSRIHNRPTLEILVPRLINTTWLMAASLFLSLILAIPSGIYSALHPYSRSDYFINLLALGGISIPVFWLALMLIILFSVSLGWLPAGGMGSTGDGGLTDRISHMILPVVTLSIASIGSLTRYVRSAMMEVLRNEYIRTARAKGLSRYKIVYKHALRNAMIPVVTVLALSFGTLFSGALITETMFSYLGMGKLIYDSIIGNDYNLALVSLLFATGLVLTGNLLADLAYAWLDPRISYG